MSYCSRCGAELFQGASFCSECGATVENLATEAVTDIEKIVEETETSIVGEVIDVEPVFEENDELAEVVEEVVQEKKDHTVKGRVLGILGFVLAIDSMMGCMIPFVNITTLFASIISVIFCNVSKKDTNMKVANVGGVLSWIALACSVITIIIYVVAAVIAIQYLISSGFLNILIMKLVYYLGSAAK